MDEKQTIVNRVLNRIANGKERSEQPSDPA